jgi:hypothetical protein
MKMEVTSSSETFVKITNRHIVGNSNINTLVFYFGGETDI